MQDAVDRQWTSQITGLVHGTKRTTTPESLRLRNGK